MKDFLIRITDLDGKIVGELKVPDMGADNDFVDIISFAYHNISLCEYKIFPKRTREHTTFVVTVFKIDTLGRERMVSTMDIDLEKDASFDEILNLCYHGCTDN